ncbi:MAG: hypothetical protein IKI75_09875 [Lachnospiraceae bacterium]|nr:hypothetical protein [Lachnospiraceae bacterium]
MGFLDTVANTAGDLPKAVIFVRRYQPNLLYTDSQLQTQEQLMQGMAEEEAKASMEGFLQNMGATALDSTNTSLGKMQDALDGAGAQMRGSASFERMRAQAELNGYVAMEVQYNPSSIYLDTSAGLREIDNSSISNIMNNQVTQITTDSITTLGMQLVFDAMNQQDAFMLDSPSLLSAGGVASMVQDLWNSEGFSVRTQVEGLIACLLSPLTRRIIFCWSDIFFKGELNQVNANYTMFNKKGNPIRATVDIAIQQDHKAEGSQRGSHWYKAFDKAFGEAGMDNLVGAASGWAKGSNNALLNFSI